MTVVARAPGRVNLIGDHTDYTGGLVLPMAIDRETVVTGEPGGEDVVLRSTHDDEPASVPLAVENPRLVHPAWARYVAGVVHQLVRAAPPSAGFDGVPVSGTRFGGVPMTGLRGDVSSTVPVGSGLSSSAALELAVALALGFRGSPLELAQLCQLAEHVATGVPCGIMDQLSSAAGIAGHALLIDCHDLTVLPVPMPDDVEVVVVHSGQPRALADSAYAERVAQCSAAEAVVGPLRLASLDDVATIPDELVRRRATHVVAENDRVRRFAAALDAGDLVSAGRLMVQSHESLRDLYDVSTDVLDALVARLGSTPGVFGARVTGAGFGGCVVALTEPGALREGWVVRAVDGASVVEV
jgi:galactokinase